MRINNNVMALNAHRQLGVNQTNGAKSMERLSSGLRINRAGDDAAGLAISEKMRGQIRGLKQASRNAQDGISLIQTAEGALSEIHAILQRMRELAVQASTDTNTLDDRKEIQKEINQLLEEIDRIADNTEFNTKKLINGDLAASGTSGVGNGDNGGEAQAAVLAGEAITHEFTGGDLDLSAAAVEFNLTVGEETAQITLSKSDYDSIQAIVDDINDQIEAGDLDGLVLASVVDDAIVFTVQNTDDSIEISGGTNLSSVGLSEDSADPTTGTVDGDGTTGGVTVSNLKVSDSDIDSVTTDTEAAALANAGVLTQAGADAAITNINTAITQVSAERSKLGAYQNRLEHTISNLKNSAENLQAAESRIRDLDMAEEMMAFTKNNILQQAATAMLAQANMAPQSVLQLLG